MIYLSGAMGCYGFGSKEYNREAVKWRKDIISNLSCFGYDFFDPTKGLDFNHDVITQNKYYLNHSDIVVVNLKDIEKSLGTIAEIVYAKLNDIPVIAFGQHEWKSHPYLTDIVSSFCNDIQEVCDLILTIYIQ